VLVNTVRLSVLVSLYIVFVFFLLGNRFGGWEFILKGVHGYMEGGVYICCKPLSNSATV